MSASLAAYSVAMADLFASSPSCYFWTFTFAETQPIWRATPAWSSLQRQLFDWFGRFQGVRVAEMHKDHGLHFHVVINVRLPVAVVRRLAARYGFGRIEVQTVRSQKGTTRYLVEYLAKGESLPCRGMRRWTRLGGIGEPVKNFVCQSDLAKEIRSVLSEGERCIGRKFTRAERFLTVKGIRRAWDSGRYRRRPVQGFSLHNGPEFDLTKTVPNKRRAVLNQWSS